MGDLLNAEDRERFEREDAAKWKAAFLKLSGTVCHACEAEGSTCEACRTFMSLYGEHTIAISDPEA